MVPLIIAALFGTVVFAGGNAALDVRVGTLTHDIALRTGAEVQLGALEGFGFDTRIAGTAPTTWQAWLALRALDTALDAYPDAFLTSSAPDILLTGDLTLLGFDIGGTVQPPSWVLLATDYVRPGLTAYVQQSFHHEFSSVLIKNTPFPEQEWAALLPQGFAWPTTDAQRLAATQDYADDLNGFYQRGFVSDYGVSSLENDINTYAEHLMHDPQGLAELAQNHPMIRAKTLLIRGYYIGLHPEFAAKFNLTALGTL